MRHAAPIVFPLDSDGGENVYRVHPINVQLMIDPVVIPAMEVLINTSHVTSCIVVLKDVIKVALLQKGQNDRIKNIVSVFYGIQCALNNVELSSTIMINSSPDHNTSASKTVGLVHTLVLKHSPRLRYTRYRPSLKRSENRDSSLKRMCCQV